MNSIMKTLDNIIDTVKNFVKANKKLFFLIIGVIVVLIGFSVYKNIQKSNIDKIPIKSIKVTCDHEFKIDSKLSNGLDYFTVTAIREGGVESELDSSNLKLSQDFVNPYGKTTKMEASYDVNGKEYKCNVEVPNERKKVIGFQCGYPNVKDVVAVLYSNGELAFEGEGDTLVFYENEYPWLTNWWEEAGVDEEKVPSIKSVTFDSKVKPTNLNYAFEGLQHLVYVGKIPDSIRTMVSTFAGCTSLKNAADLSSAYEYYIDLRTKNDTESVCKILNAENREDGDVCIRIICHWVMNNGILCETNRPMIAERWMTNQELKNLQQMNVKIEKS